MKTKKTALPLISRIDLRSLIKPLLFALGMVYLGFHALHGERGVYALLRETHHESALQKELAKTRTEREALELKVSHLRNESLDLDLLDEQHRRMLGGIGKGEVMVLDKQ